MTDPNQYNPQNPQQAQQYGGYGSYGQNDYGQQAPQYGAPDYGQQAPQYGAPQYSAPQCGRIQPAAAAIRRTATSATGVRQLLRTDRSARPAGLQLHHRRGVHPLLEKVRHVQGAAPPAANSGGGFCAHSSSRSRLPSSSRCWAPSSTAIQPMECEASSTPFGHWQRLFHPLRFPFAACTTPTRPAPRWSSSTRLTSSVAFC